MNEAKQLELMMAGIIPGNYGALGNNTTNRKDYPFTWNDLEFNLNDIPYHSDTAIIVTSYNGQLGWLKATLESYRRTGAFVILSYDNPVYVWSNYDDPEYQLRYLPRGIHYLLAHTVAIKHKTYDADKRTGWYWDIKYGQNIINGFKNFKYVYCTNGDCILERPEGIAELPAILGDGDLMSGQSEPGRTIHTADMFFKIDAFNKVIDYMSDRMKVPVIGSLSPEGLLREAVDLLKLKETFVDSIQMPDGSLKEFSGAIDKKDGSIDYYGKIDGDCTWKRVLGFKNLYHEFEYRENNSLEPLDKKYMDPYRDYMYFRDTWRETVCMYYKTGDRRYLGRFWDLGKDSDYERRDLPLEAYGPEPIYDVNVPIVAKV